MLAAKFHDDAYYSNAYYAKVGGLTLREINLLEAKMLQMLNWKALVEVEEYQLYMHAVCQATRPPVSEQACRPHSHKEKEPEP